MQSVKLFVEYTKSKDTSDLFLEKQSKLALTPLLVASGKGQYDIVEYLVKNNANVAARDQDGDTAVHLIAMLLHNLKDKPMESDESEIYKVGSISQDYAVTKFYYIVLNHGCLRKRTEDDTNFTNCVFYLIYSDLP